MPEIDYTIAQVRVEVGKVGKDFFLGMVGVVWFEL